MAENGDGEKAGEEQDTCDTCSLGVPPVEGEVPLQDLRMRMRCWGSCFRKISAVFLWRTVWGCQSGKVR